MSLRHKTSRAWIGFFLHLIATVRERSDRSVRDRVVVFLKLLSMVVQHLSSRDSRDRPFGGIGGVDRAVRGLNLGRTDRVRGHDSLTG